MGQGFGKGKYFPGHFVITLPGKPFTFAESCAGRLVLGGGQVFGTGGVSTSDRHAGRLQLIPGRLGASTQQYGESDDK